MKNVLVKYFNGAGVRSRVNSNLISVLGVAKDLLRQGMLHVPERAARK